MNSIIPETTCSVEQLTDELQRYEDLDRVEALLSRLDIVVELIGGAKLNYEGFQAIQQNCDSNLNPGTFLQVQISFNLTSISTR